MPKVLVAALILLIHSLVPIAAPGPAGAEPQYLPNVGPSRSTYFCQTRVAQDYQQGTEEAIDPPLTIDPALPIEGQGAVFDGVRLVTLPPGTVTPAWECTEENSCYDDRSANPRGTALLWVPEGLKRNAPRALYIHGGSWYYGSPWTNGYPTFAAKLAKTLQMSVLVLDYTLAPVGDFETILRQVGEATNFLARHRPLDLLAGKLKPSKRAKKSPPLFIMGDSSGGGTAISALVAQASEAGLPGARGAVLRGGVVYSPWVNLLSNSPTYLSNLNSVHQPGDYSLGDVAFGIGAVEDLVSSYQVNAQDYMGEGSLTDPVANPFFAPARWLKRLPPISFHVGQPELLLSDNAILANRIAESGGLAEFHQYDGMWHVFPMYEEGCGSGEPVVLAQSAYEATRTFLRGLARGKRPSCKQAPCFFGHYEYPQGKDTAHGLSAFRGR